MTLTGDDVGAHDTELPEQLRVRHAKRDRMLARGVDPYPVLVPRTRTLAQVRAEFDDLGPAARSGADVAVAGRVIFLRNTGRLCFARLRDGDGTELQAMLSESDVGPAALADWKELVDIGDQVAVEGEVVTSRRGELSVAARRWTMAAKALRPLPVAHRPLSEEARIRQRYVDLVVRPAARHFIRARAAVLASVRRTLDSRGFLEVETPQLQPIHGGAAARPFTTELNEFHRPYYLRIATELYLKRLVVGGVHRVYEIGRVFRNEGIDSTHSPEFTELEVYQAYTDYRGMAELTRQIVLDAAAELGTAVVPDGRGGEIDLSGHWRWLPVYTAVSDALGEEVTPDSPASVLRGFAHRREVALRESWGPAEILLELYEQLVEPNLREPTFVCDYPVEVRPLARNHRDDPRLTESFDLVVGGIELAPAYSELTDPVEQRRRFVAQAEQAGAGDPEAMQLDEDFLRALEYGLPPTGGMGMGIDRLIMVLTGARSVRETIAFPLVKPQG